MKSITFLQIHKLISQTSVYLLLLLILTTLLDRFGIVDQHQDERMNGFIVNYIRGGLLYSITIFYLVSFYTFISTSISTIKDITTRKQSFIYIVIYAFSLLFSLYFELILKHQL